MTILYTTEEHSRCFTTTDEDKAYAKHFVGYMSEYFYVKCYTMGHKLVNPIDPNLRHLEKPTSMGFNTVQWVKVSKNVFNNYVNFLKSKKEFYLQEAERERLNG